MRKTKKVFKYGNYEHYYGYRKGHSNEIDKRVKLFRKEWFDGKKVLDIGCNAGLVTLDIGMRMFETLLCPSLTISQTDSARSA